MYEVIVLKEGYSIQEGAGQQRSCGTITLLKGPTNVIVDTGNPWDKEVIIDGLKKHDLTPDKIEYVVCTHGHSDHVGNLNLFLNAIHIVCQELCAGDLYLGHDFRQGIPYEIDEDVEVVSTPGHTTSDVSVIVRNTSKGTIAVTGDLFERFEDLEDFSLWQENSQDPQTQQQNRLQMLKFADWIVPGHGPMFQVPKEQKQQLKMVMYEDVTVYQGPDGTHTAVNYGIIEETE